MDMDMDTTQDRKAAAEAYERMTHNPTAPTVVASYAALAEAIVAQYAALRAVGIELRFQAEDPGYLCADMLEDLALGGIGVYADGGATLPEDHPMRAIVETVDGPMVLNDVFRGVHDVVGHGAAQIKSFGPRGEFSAYEQHRKSLPVSSWMALWCETRGQNTWTNAFADHDQRPLRDRPFAEQKAGNVPAHLYA